jgi:hypothetical protein
MKWRHSVEKVPPVVRPQCQFLRCQVVGSRARACQLGAVGEPDPRNDTRTHPAQNTNTERRTHTALTHLSALRMMSLIVLMFVG